MDYDRQELRSRAEKQFTQILVSFEKMVIEMITKWALLKGLGLIGIKEGGGTGAAAGTAGAAGGSAAAQTAATGSLTAFTAAINTATSAIGVNTSAKTETPAVLAATGAHTANAPAVTAGTVAHATNAPAVTAGTVAHVAHVPAVLADTVGFVAHEAAVLADTIATLVHKAIELFTASTGGLIQGPGTGTSDSIPIRVSHGEYIVKADTVKKPGMLETLHALNSGKIAGVQFLNGDSQTAGL